METSVKWFSSEMAGAPVVNNAAGSLIAMLDACLVSGFGLKSVSTLTVSGGVATVALATGNFLQQQIVLVEGATPAGLNGEKRVLTLPGASSFTFDATGVADGAATGTITVKTAPLGWLKEFSGTNKAVYKIDPALHPDAPAFRVRIDDNGAYTAGIVGYESMTNVDTGVAPFPTTGQVARLALMKTNFGTVGRSWFVVGDGKSVYAGVHSYDTSITSYGPSWFAFGKVKSKKSVDDFGFVVTGNLNSDSGANNSESQSVASTNATYVYSARSYLGTGASVSLGGVKTWLSDPATSGYGASGSSISPMSYPNGPDYGLYLVTASLFEGMHYRADWPGMYMIPQRVTGQICPNNKTAYLDTEVAGFENKVVGFFPCAASTAGAQPFGVVAFDLTGPWEH